MLNIAKIMVETIHLSSKISNKINKNPFVGFDKPSLDVALLGIKFDCVPNVATSEGGRCLKTTWKNFSDADLS